MILPNEDEDRVNLRLGVFSTLLFRLTSTQATTTARMMAPIVPAAIPPMTAGDGPLLGDRGSMSPSEAPVVAPGVAVGWTAGGVAEDMTLDVELGANLKVELDAGIVEDAWAGGLLWSSSMTHTSFPPSKAHVKPNGQHWPDFWHRGNAPVRAKVLTNDPGVLFASWDAISQIIGSILLHPPLGVSGSTGQQRSVVFPARARQLWLFGQQNAVMLEHLKKSLGQVVWRPNTALGGSAVASSAPAMVRRDIARNRKQLVRAILREENKSTLGNIWQLQPCLCQLSGRLGRFCRRRYLSSDQQW